MTLQTKVWMRLAGAALLGFAWLEATLAVVGYPAFFPSTLGGWLLFFCFSLPVGWAIQLASEVYLQRLIIEGLIGVPIVWLQGRRSGRRWWRSLSYFVPLSTPERHRFSSLFKRNFGVAITRLTDQEKVDLLRRAVAIASPGLAWKLEALRAESILARDFAAALVLLGIVAGLSMNWVGMVFFSLASVVILLRSLLLIGDHDRRLVLSLVGSDG